MLHIGIFFVLVVNIIILEMCQSIWNRSADLDPQVELFDLHPPAELVWLPIQFCLEIFGLLVIAKGSQAKCLYPQYGQYMTGTAF